MRIWAIRHIGRSARTRLRKAKKLVNSGPYQYVRNPIYIGNFFIIAGFCVLSELLWFFPIMVAFFIFQYSFIVHWEEDLLFERFGVRYQSYCLEVNRWVPTGRQIRKKLYFLPEALFREKSTLIALSCGVVGFLIIKEYFLR